MYSDIFCKVYNEFGWNYYPEAFGDQLLQWIAREQVTVDRALDLACGTGILCKRLWEAGIRASGMDFSPGMIEIAKKNCPELEFDVADMITYCPERRYDLVTCTGDALNHILNPNDVERIFSNVYRYLAPGGYFIFDLLREEEAQPGPPFDLEFSETVRATFQITREENRIFLNTAVFEHGVEALRETITEVIHDPERVCQQLERQGFQILRRDSSLTGLEENRGTTWYILARKPQEE